LSKILLKYEGRCIRCGKAIPAGEKAYWEKNKGVWHLACDRVSHGDLESKRLWTLAVLLVIVAFMVGGLVLGPVLGPKVTTTATVTETSRETATYTTTVAAATIGTEKPTSQAPACKGAARCWEGKVTKIVDGDTLEVDSLRIRLALVDTPEWDQPGGSEASQFTARLCPVGSKVLVDQDDKQLVDVYGRLLAVVWCSGRNLNRELLYAGIGHIDTSFCTRSEFETEDWAKEYGC